MSSDSITAPISNQTFAWPLSWIAHYFIAVVGSMTVGFLPEAFAPRFYYNSGLEPYSPMIAVAAFLLGYFPSGSVFNGRVATFIWTIGVVWMLFGIYDVTRGWSATWSPEKTLWGYVFVNMFGPTPRCSGSECLYKLFFTTPLTASIAYFIGAYAAKRRSVSPAA